MHSHRLDLLRFPSFHGCVLSGASRGKGGAAKGDDQAPKLTKAARTRGHILETALRLFRERGYDGTTMRGIATAADVSLGSTYYYFKSKEHLIQAFYERSHAEHLVACVDVLESETDLERRLLHVLNSKIETSAPFKRFAVQLFKTAADPESPLSPFSTESMPVRREATELMELVVTGSSTKVSPELAKELPNLLWLYLMAVILFWIHDDSEGCARTYKLIDRTAELVVRLIGLAAFVPMRPLVHGALKLLIELRELSSHPDREDPDREDPGSADPDSEDPASADQSVGSTKL